MDIPEDEGLPIQRWIVTFTDLMSLLLTFFLLLTFSTPRVEKLFELRGSIDGSFGIFTGPRDDKDSISDSSQILIGRDQRNPFSPSTPPRYLPMEERLPNIDSVRLKDQDGQAIDFQKRRRGLRHPHLKIACGLRLGRLEMSAESFRRVAKLIKAETAPYHLVLVGYVGVDEVGLIRQQGKDVMDIAMRRAVGVSERLVEAHQMNPDIFAVAGYGPQPGDTGLGRVEEFVLADKRRFAGRR